MEQSKRRKKRFVERIHHPRVKREEMKVCNEHAVFGVQFKSLDSYHFLLEPEQCFCGYDDPAIKGWPYRPGEKSNDKQNYYPGDVYDYYAVTMDPWDAALIDNFNISLLLSFLSAG